MIKSALATTTWVIDGEWIPDLVVGRRVLRMPDADDATVLAAMYQAAGATAENPKPYLKVFQCRIVALTALVRTMGRTETTWKLVAMPQATGDAPMSELDIITRFWNGVQASKPQIVGYNVGSADLGILSQRALVHGVQAPALCRPSKPWEGADYCDAKNSGVVLDLKNAIAPFEYRDAPKLDQIAVACGLPGKVGVGGDDVAAMWASGKWREIARYNQCDTCTTAMLWLRVAHLAGLLDRQQAEFEAKQIAAIAAGLAKEPHGELLQAWMNAYHGLFGETDV